MITKYKKHHRIIATVFLIIFFPTLVPNNLFASNNGPKSPEAASFEPVDATDMVNLITGQYSYVLPLLNVPSPEGGYPIALGYHAGIALEQESSWAGLGWNVNPGAIDRSVNGYPDDYNASHLNEYFYDSGGQESASFVSMGYSLGVASVGIGFNWGSNQALGGYVSVGAGMDLGGGVKAGISVTAGTEGASIGLNAQFSGGLSIGINASTNGTVGAVAGFSTNGEGLSIGYNSSGTFSFSTISQAGTEFSISTSKSGTHMTMSGIGVGMSTSFNNTIKMGDYSTSLSSWSIPITVPTPVGIFSLSFGSQSFKYWLALNKDNYVTGSLYFQNGVKDISKQKYIPYYQAIHHAIFSCGKTANNPDGYCQYTSPYCGTHNSAAFQWNVPTHFCSIPCVNPGGGDGFNEQHSIPAHYVTVNNLNAFMDINEIPITNGILSAEINPESNNASFPNYDSFNVQAQGLSGSISAPIYKNGALIGLSANENSQEYSLKYHINGSTAVPDYAKFNTKPNFYLENEISTYINVSPASYNTDLTNVNILDYYIPGSVELPSKPRRQTSTFVEYYSNGEIADDIANLKQNGFLQANVSGFNRAAMPKDGIGAFKITAVDGKTYHYSLPVYNHEIITRTSGGVSNERQDESQSYMEKRQLDPYATHWLLTAVTGPDFVDNGDGVAGEGDLGYWTSFEYGKWTDAFIWKAPYKKDYIYDNNNPKIKTWIRGRKQLYYLDKIKTRTHTALFIKSARTDSQSENWVYNSVNHADNASGDYGYRFTVPSQNQLRLDKIILLKNQDETVDKTFGQDSDQSVVIGYLNSDKTGEDAKYNIWDNVLDSQDNWQNTISKAIKIIDFNYDYSLVPGDNRLTLKSVNFKGKGGTNVLPPYKFDYINDTDTFDIEKKDDWGYLRGIPYMFSLKKITTPQGGTIEIAYEKNKCKSVVDRVSLEFKHENYPNYRAYDIDHNTHTAKISIGSDYQNYNLLGKVVNINYRIQVCKNGNDILTNKYYNNEDTGIISRYLGNGIYEVHLDNTNVISYDDTATYYGGDCLAFDPNTALRIALFLDPNEILDGGGTRVSSLKVSDGIENYITDYKYGENEDGIGYVSYVPYDQYLAQELSYSSELPAPRVMYEYVTQSSHKEAIVPETKIRYKFKIMKERTNNLKFGEFYEITESDTPLFLNSLNKFVKIKSFTVKENFAAIGQLLEVSTLNSKNQLLDKVYNNYYGINEIPSNMGVTKESYQTYKEVDYTTDTTIDKWIINSSTRIKYPAIIKSSTEQKNGYTYTTDFLDYDLVSGVSKEQRSISSDNQSLRTRKIPAYLKYPEMGSKVDNPTNKNMLSQTAAEYSYILDNGTWKETGVGITTWNNIWSYKDIAGNNSTPSLTNEKIWRKHKTYVWNGVKDANGIFTNYDNITDSKDDKFVWTVGVGSQPTQWKQTSEVTLYDHFSAPLEMKDINENLASTKMGDDDSKVMATGNAGYSEMFFSGAENITGDENVNVAGTNWLEPEVKMVNAKRNKTYFHTGTRSIEATNSSQFGASLGGILPNGTAQHRAGKYKVSVWVEKTNAAKAILKVNNTAVSFQTDAIMAGNWQLKTAYISIPAEACTVYLSSADASTVYFDDLMIRPVASSITGYVYNEWDELTYIIANNGLATKFEYDDAGRLIKTYSEVIDDANNGVTGGFKLIKSFKMNNKYLN